MVSLYLEIALQRFMPTKSGVTLASDPVSSESNFEISGRIAVATIGYTDKISSPSRNEKMFFFQMAIVCAVIAFVGFAPTYWAPLLTGKLNVHPIIHLHGAVFFLWSVYFVYQAWLAASGRLARHRAVGLVGVSLATAMVCVGLLGAVTQMRIAPAALVDAHKVFSIVPITVIVFFAGAFTAAITLRRQTDWHQRLILVAAVSILEAPVARWFIVFLAPAGPPGPPPIAVTLLPALLSLLPLFVAMIYDWRTRKAVHPAYVLGGVGFVTLKLLQAPLSETAAWHALATWLLALAG